MSFGESLNEIEEKAYSKGIILGMLKYEQDRSNEFRDWCPYDPLTIAEKHNQ